MRIPRMMSCARLCWRPRPFRPRPLPRGASWGSRRSSSRSRRLVDKAAGAPAYSRHGVTGKADRERLCVAP
jgi:hypothetical protein